MAITSSTGPSDTEKAALAALLAGGGPNLAGNTGKVYMGKKPPVRIEGRGYHRPKGSWWVSEDEAYQSYFTWDQKKQQDFIAQGILSGMLKLGDGPMEGSKLWKKLTKEASMYGGAGKKVSPFDLMASYVQASGGTGANAWRQQGVWEVNVQTGERRYAGPGEYLGKGKAQQTDTRIDLTDPDTARAISTQLFQDLMGRDPGQGELGAFANALNSAEQSSPVVSTTTTQYDMDTGQQLDTETTQSGGLTAEARGYIGQQQIKGSKEYGAYQAATTYQNALESLIYGSPE